MSRCPQPRRLPSPYLSGTRRGEVGGNAALTQELWGPNNEPDDALDDERPAWSAIKKASKRLRPQ